MQKIRMHRPTRFPHSRTLSLPILVCVATIVFAQPAQSPLVAGVDNMVRTRFERVLSFTDVEHYSVFRGNDETHPVAQMTVRVTYRKSVGKSYKILSESGSSIFLHFGLKPLLENEKSINDPTTVSASWLTTDNYAMTPEPARTQTLEGRRCVAIRIKPLRKAPNMVNGTLWIDPTDFAILRVEGQPSKSPSIFAGTTHMMRDYSIIDGFAQATHARAESDGLFGRTVIVIQYSDYHIQLAPAH
jgi:hypothetical protein